MSEPLLEVRNLTKYFGVTRGFLKRQVATCRAVDDVSFTLKQGEVLGIVGESGCGKSTLARSVIRLIEPTSGEIYFMGENLRALKAKALRQWRPKAQMVFQDPFASLNPRHTVGENIGEAALVHGAVRPDQLRSVVGEVLERVGLPPAFADRYPHQFSGGQQQRICIARAIALGPELLICDEAVSALDVSVQAQILNLLAELRRSLRLSLLFISHDLSVIRHLCDRILVLYLGKVVESGSAEAIFADPRHPYTQVLLSAVPKDHPRQKRERILLQGDPPSPLHPPPGCSFHTRCPVAQPECSQAPPPTQTGSLPTHIYRCIH